MREGLGMMCRSVRKAEAGMVASRASGRNKQLSSRFTVRLAISTIYPRDRVVISMSCFSSSQFRRSTADVKLSTTYLILPTCPPSRFRWDGRTLLLLFRKVLKTRYILGPFQLLCASVEPPQSAQGISTSPVQNETGARDGLLSTPSDQ